MATNPRSISLGSMALGVNNRLEQSRLGKTLPDRSPATFLSAADNVDITADGFVKRRRGTTIEAAGRAHSIWADVRGAFVVIDGDLTELSDAGGSLARTVVRQGLPQLPVSYSRGADGAVYWSNGMDLRRVIAGADRPVVTAAPADPGETVSAGGALPPGKYLLALTAISEDGESPATPAVQLDVPENGSILLPAAHHVYLSAPDGEILTYQGFLASVLTHNENGRQCPTLNTAPMPAGTIVRHFKGMLLTVIGNVLYFSRPYNYGVYDPSAGYVAFAEAITVLEPTDRGLYLCAEKTWLLADLVGSPLQELLPYGAIPGSGGRTPDSETVFWNTTRGLVLAGPDGSVRNVQEDALRFSEAVASATLYREQNGMAHILATRAGAQPTQAGASSFAEAEVFRQGTIL